MWSSRDDISVIEQRDRVLERDMVGPGGIWEVKSAQLGEELATGSVNVNFLAC